MRARKCIAPTVVLAATTGLAVLPLPAPSSADSTTLVNFTVKCEPDCPANPVVLPFTVEKPNVRVTLTSPGTGPCARGIADVEISGRYHSTRRVGPGWEQPPFEMDLGAVGHHIAKAIFRTLSDCKEGQPDGIAGTLRIDEVAAAPAEPKPAEPNEPVEPPADPVPAPLIATVVKEDVDVYDKPNVPPGSARYLGILRKDKKVEVLGSAEAEGQPCMADSWCKVKGADVPSGQGVIWGHLEFD